MYERIIQILEQAGQDKQLVLLSVTGKGKFYSAGTDLADFAKMAVRLFKINIIISQTNLDPHTELYLKESD